MSRTLRITLTLGGLFSACCLLTLVVTLLLSGGNPVDAAQNAVIWLRLQGRQAALNTPSGTSTDPIRFQVQTGDSPRTVAANLAATGLIPDVDLFVDYVRLQGIDRRLQAGVYFLNAAQSPAAIAEALTDSRASQFPFRILEGWRMEEIAEVIDGSPAFGFSGADFLAAVGQGSMPDPTFSTEVGLPLGSSLEGFLFPNTYQLPGEVTPELLRDFLLTEFANQMTEADFEAASQAGLSMFDVVRLASIVQREAVRVDEMPLIASVYQNRLNIGMKLDADPTVQYAIGFRDGSWWPPITQADYSAVQSPFNTYLNPGLPPGAIANPGLAAIRAVLYPEVSPYLYFRARCDGSGYHNFAVTFDEHLANAC